ncbi:MAG: hypothetical protein ACRDMJ_13315 [Solirubrobacteraceae bacterium]
MRRFALIATALAVLVAAGGALAASSSQVNTYKATLKFTPKAAGTAKKPVPVSFTQDIKAAGTNGNRTAVLSDITTKVYGIKADGKDFPTCSSKKIAAAQNDTVCPKGAMVASGWITAVLGSSTNFQQAGAACDPLLHVWNGGQGHLTFFFVDQGSHQCLGGSLHTGQVGPYPATYKMKGKYMVLDVPIPGFVDYPLGTSGGLAGSLESEHLVWKKATKKVHGKTVATFASIGCQGKKRPYSTTFKAALPGQPTQTSTVSAKAPC